MTEISEFGGRPIGLMRLMRKIPQEAEICQICGSESMNSSFLKKKKKKLSFLLFRNDNVPTFVRAPQIPMPSPSSWLTETEPDWREEMKAGGSRSHEEQNTP